MEGSTATFSAGFVGTSATFRWYLNGVALNNGTQPDGSVVSGANPVVLASGAPFTSITGLTVVDGVPYVSDEGTSTIYQVQLNP